MNGAEGTDMNSIPVVLPVYVPRLNLHISRPANKHQFMSEVTWLIGHVTAVSILSQLLLSLALLPLCLQQVLLLQTGIQPNRRF